MKLRKIIFVTTLFILGVTMFNINENKKPMAITENTSPDFFVDENVDEDVKNNYENNLNTLPESIKNMQIQLLLHMKICQKNLN